jgi:hypothetical protein
LAGWGGVSADTRLTRAVETRSSIGVARAMKRERKTWCVVVVVVVVD